MTELKDVLYDALDNYENGQEQTGNDELVDSDYQMFNSQKQAIKKLQHLEEDQSQSQTFRKALQIGIFFTGAGHLTDEQKEELAEEFDF